jgi:hypothetical protein
LKCRECRGHAPPAGNCCAPGHEAGGKFPTDFLRRASPKCQAQQQHRRQQKSDHHRDAATDLRQQGMPAAQNLPRRASPPGAVVITRTTATDSFEQDQQRNEAQQGRDKLGRGNAITPAKTTRGKCRW